MGDPDQYREAMSQPGSQQPSKSKADQQMEEQKNDKPYRGSFMAPDGEHQVTTAHKYESKRNKTKPKEGADAI